MSRSLRSRIADSCRGPESKGGSTREFPNLWSDNMVGISILCTGLCIIYIYTYIFIEIDFVNLMSSMKIILDS